MSETRQTNEQRARKVNAMLIGDAAVDAELLIVKLGIGDSAKKKADIDAELVGVALEALNAVVDATKREIGSKHPSVGDVRNILQKGLTASKPSAQALNNIEASCDVGVGATHGEGVTVAAG